MQKASLRWCAALCGFLALLSLTSDVYQIMIEEFDYSQHIPFFPFALVLGFFAAAFLFLHRRNASPP